MVKEELEKEAEEFLKKNNYTSGYIGYFASGYCKQSYLAGAEPREKRIVELEEEVANLEGIKLAQETALSKEYIVEEQLRKENTELKTDYKVLSCSVGDFGELQDKLEEEQRKNNGLSDNLTKAKEIMQKLIVNAPDTYSGTNIELQQKKMFSFQDAVNKADQFLNSEVEK